MTKSEAEEIKTRIEVFNTLYSPIELTFQMIKSEHPHDEDNWFVKIVYNYTENEWMTFHDITWSHAQIMDKLNGYQFALEAVMAYQEEHGNLNLAQ